MTPFSFRYRRMYAHLYSSSRHDAQNLELWIGAAEGDQTIRHALAWVPELVQRVRKRANQARINIKAPVSAPLA